MERMCLELKGIPCIGLVETNPNNKSIMCSRSFGRPITHRHELEQAVSTYTGARPGMWCRRRGGGVARREA
jgi:DNA polymerase V